jgi:hypothetical protein
LISSLLPIRFDGKEREGKERDEEEQNNPRRQPTIEKCLGEKPQITFFLRATQCSVPADSRHAVVMCVGGDLRTPAH